MALRILRNTEEQLTIYSPATMSRFFGICLLAVGGILIALGVGLCLASLGIPVMRMPVGGTADKVGGTLFVLLAGAIFALPGLWILRRARDRTFDLVAAQRVLHVRSSRENQTVPFSRILRAELTEAPDEGTTVYGLGIALRSPDETLHITDGYTPEQDHKRAVAQMINEFLARNANTHAVGRGTE